MFDCVPFLLVVVSSSKCEFSILSLQYGPNLTRATHTVDLTLPTGKGNMRHVFVFLYLGGDKYWPADLLDRLKVSGSFGIT